VQSAKAAIVLCLALSTGGGMWYLQTWAPNRQWKLADEAGRRLLSQARYGEAERQFSLAVESTRSFDKHDPRRALSLFHLAQSLVGQSKLAEALPLLERAATIHEKGLGHDHPDGRQMREYREDLMRGLAAATNAGAENRPDVSSHQSPSTN
jgi:Tetratricopeptide repeat